MCNNLMYQKKHKVLYKKKKIDTIDCKSFVLGEYKRFT